MLLESGDFLSARNPGSGSGDAQRARADLILRAYVEMGYDAVLPGEADLALGLPFLRERERRGIPFTCLNLVVDSSGRTLFTPYRRFSLAGEQVLVAGVVGEEAFPQGFLAARGWKALPAAQALRDLAARELPPDGVLVVLSHLGEAGDIALARSLGRPALVLGAHSQRSFRRAVRETGSLVLHPQGRGTCILEVSVGGAGAGRHGAARGFADGAALEGYRERKRSLQEEMGRMDETRRGIYGNALGELDNAIREAEWQRPVDARERKLGPEIPDDPGIAARIAGHRKGAGRPGRP